MPLVGMDVYNDTLSKSELNAINPHIVTLLAMYQFVTDEEGEKFAKEFPQLNQALWEMRCALKEISINVPVNLILE